MGAHGFRGRRPRTGPGDAHGASPGFVVTLRDAGFVIGQAEAQDAARLMSSPMAERPERLRAAMRALFASRRSDLARFDELFDAFWRGRGVKSVVRIDAEALAARSPRRFQHGPGASDPRREPTRIGEGPLARGRRQLTAAGDRAARRRRRRCRRRTSRLRGRAGARRSRRARRTLRARDARQAHASRAGAPARPAARPARDDPAQRRPRRRTARPQVPPAQDQAAADSSRCSTPPARWSPTSRSSPASCTPSRRSFANPRRSCFIPGSRMSRPR